MCGECSICSTAGMGDERSHVKQFTYADNRSCNKILRHFYNSKVHAIYVVMPDEKMMMFISYIITCITAESTQNQQGLYIHLLNGDMDISIGSFSTSVLHMYVDMQYLLTWASECVQSNLEITEFLENKALW